METITLTSPMSLLSDPDQQPMSTVVDHLAELTGFRDRDVLDTTLANALRDLLQPLCVGIHRCVGDDVNRRWLTRARLVADEVAASADPISIDFDALPAMNEFPVRLAAVELQTVVVVPGNPHVSVFPLATDRAIVGVVEIDTEDPLSFEQQRLVGSILRIYHNFHGVLDYSERDTLTGLLNRKTFDETFLKITRTRQDGSGAKDERRMQSGGQTFFIGVIDIDRFKSVNDTYGHLIGDEVLLLLSRLMRSTFRFQDKLYRFGGEEFVVLLSASQDKDANAALERFRINVEGYLFPQVGKVTVSIGFTNVRPRDTPSSAFERADKAVYWAKSHGRNRVASHSALVQQGELRDDAKIGSVELF